MLAAVESNNNLCYHYYNYIGSTVAKTVAGQNIVKSYDYDTSGKAPAEQENINQPFKYAGQYGVTA